MTDTKGSNVQRESNEVAPEAKPKTGAKTTSSSSKTTKSASANKTDTAKKASAAKKTTKATTAKKTAASKGADAKEGVEKTTSKKSATAASPKTSAKAAKSSTSATTEPADKKEPATKKATTKKTTATTTKSSSATKTTTKTSSASTAGTATSKTSSKTASGKASSASAKPAVEPDSAPSAADAKASEKKATSSAKSAADKKTSAKTTKSTTAKAAGKSAKTTGAKTTKKAAEDVAKAAADSLNKAEKQSVGATQPIGVLEGSKSLPLEGSRAKGLPAGEEHVALASQSQKALQEDKKTALAGSDAKPLSGTSKALPQGENAEENVEEGTGKSAGAKKNAATKPTRKTAPKTAAKSTKTTKAKQDKDADTKAPSSVADALDSKDAEASDGSDATDGSATTDTSDTPATTDTSAVSSPEVLGDASDKSASPEVSSEDSPEAGAETSPKGKRPAKKTSSKTTQKTATPQKTSKTEAEKQQDDSEEDGQADKRGKSPSKTEAKKSQPTARGQRRKMFVSVMPEEQIEVVITEEGQVQEYYVEMLQQQKTKGNIYKATIHNVDANLQAAFVNYGANKNGFLQIDEVHPEYYNVPHDEKSGRRFPPIQKVLKPGQELLVQVVKEPNASKGAFLTTYLSLAGRFLVLTPGREQIGVSRKVDDGSERGRLREMLEDFKPGPGLGVIVRTVSMGMNKATLKKDLQSLKTTWKKVRGLGTEAVAPKLIHEEIGLATRSVRDYLTDQIVEVWLDDPETARDVEDIVSTLFPKKSKLVHVHTDFSISLFERFNLQRQLDQIQSREVPLPSGGRLVIDTTEALTAIDINSGRSGGKSNFEDTAFRTNMEAAKMIPLQLRLRDIGGQVVCDFIEMRDKSHWREVEKTVRASMKIDRARHDVGRISSFGLLELVRQRLGSSAISVNMEVCPHCKGSGVRRNMEWQSQQALKDIARKMRAAKEQKQSSISYGADVALAMHLLNSKRQRLNHLEEQLGVSVEITLAEQE